MKDPLALALLVITGIVGASVLLLLGKYVATDKLDKDILLPLTTLLATLVTVLGTRKKDSDPPADPPAAPPAPPAEPLPPLPPMTGTTPYDDAPTEGGNNNARIE